MSLISKERTVPIQHIIQTILHSYLRTHCTLTLFILLSPLCPLIVVSNAIKTRSNCNHRQTIAII